MPEIGRAQLVGYALAALVIVGLGVRYMHNQAAAASSGQDPARSQAAVPPESGVVAGGAGGGGGDGRAGGGARAADVNVINLAAKVADGQQIVVPRRPSSVGASAGAGGGASASAAGGSGGQVSAAGAGGAGASTGPPAAPVNLNTATIEELDTLDGVGLATAQQTIDYSHQHAGSRSAD